MQADIAVGMSQETLGVRHAHAADHDMVAFAEGVHVVAGADPDVAELGGQARFLAHEILGSCELHVGNIAFKGCNRQSRPFGNRGIVGEIRASIPCRTTMRLEDDVETKGLRRLCDPQGSALRRGLDVAAFAGDLDGVGDGNGGDRSAGAARRLDRARDHAFRDEGARGVVDQHDVRIVLGQRFEAGEHRSLPRRAAIGRWLVPEPCDRCGEHGAVVGVHHRLHREHLSVTAEGFHGAADHGHAADLAILLRPAGAGAQSTPGCDEDDRGAL
ncbi:hypothetical protein ABIA06_001178 [Bradyrhizobium yuanmingense]